MLLHTALVCGVTAESTSAKTSFTPKALKCAPSLAYYSSFLNATAIEAANTLFSSLADLPAPESLIALSLRSATFGARLDTSEECDSHESATWLSWLSTRVDHLRAATEPLNDVPTNDRGIAEKHEEVPVLDSHGANKDEGEHTPSSASFSLLAAQIRTCPHIWGMTSHGLAWEHQQHPPPWSRCRPVKIPLPNQAGSAVRLKAHHGHPPISFITASSRSRMHPKSTAFKAEYAWRHWLILPTPLTSRMQWSLWVCSASHGKLEYSLRRGRDWPQ